jgi:hypothetical protein
MIMRQNNSSQIISDISENNASFFNFDKYSEVFTNLILNSKNQTPFSIAIDGKWGCGKTSLLLTIKSRIEQIQKNKLSDDTIQNKRIVKCFWFNAWKYSEKDSLLAAVAYQLYNEKYHEFISAPWIQDTWVNIGFCQKILKLSWYPFHKFCFLIMKTTFLWDNRICLLRSASDLTKTVSNSKTPDFYKWFKDPLYQDKLSFYSNFERFLNLLIQSIVTPDKSTNISKQGKSLVFFIDDLDRCSPENITSIISTIRLFFDQEGCIFVLGMDLDTISTAIESYYRSQGYQQINGKEYLKKMIQLRFNLPPIRGNDIEQFIDEIIHPDIYYKPFLAEILMNIDNNPREIKRFFNDINFLKTISRSVVNEVLADELIIKWCLLIYISEDFIMESKIDPDLLLLMQSYSKNKEVALFNYKEYLEESMENINSGGETFREKINNNKFDKFRYNPQIISVLNCGNWLFDKENIRNYIYISSFVRDSPIPTKKEWYEAWVDRSTHEKGNKIVFGGRCTKKDIVNVKIWIFGPNSFFLDTIQLDDKNIFKYELSADFTRNLEPGDYFSLFQFHVEENICDYSLGKSENVGFVVKINSINRSEVRLFNVANIPSSWDPIKSGGLLTEEFNNNEPKISYLKISFRLYDGDVNIVVGGTGSYNIGSTIFLTGINSESENTFLFIHGESTPDGGGSLTDPTKPVINDFFNTFTIIPVEKSKTWDYYWDTSDLLLKPGRYAIFAVSSPKDKFHLKNSHWSKVTILIKSN